MKRILIILAAAAILFASCTPSPSTPRSVNIISVGFNYSGDNHLDGPSEDAMAFAEEIAYLSEAAGYEIKAGAYVTDEPDGSIICNGTKISVEEFFSIFSIISAEEKDLNIFFFSGHGIYEDGYGSCIALPNVSLLPLSEIASALSSAGGKSIMLIDACNSGSLAPGIGSGEIFDDSEDHLLESVSTAEAIADAFRSSFTKARSYGNVYAIAACTPLQFSYIGDETSAGFSRFTYELLEALGYDAANRTPGLPDKKEITFTDLYRSIYKSLMESPVGYVPDRTWGEIQTPQPSRVPTDLVLFRF